MKEFQQVVEYLKGNHHLAACLQQEAHYEQGDVSAICAGY